MTTYYFGDIEFGDFMKSNGDYYPVALMHRVDEVRDFDTDQEADDYCMDQGYAAYLDTQSKMEIYFKGR